MAIAISVANEKGGTGKSTICSNLGALLAFWGFRVLMVDMDPQGHLSDLTGTDKADGICNLLTHPKTEKDPRGYAIGEVIVEIPAEYHGGEGWLGLLPGHKRTQLAAVDMQLQGFDYMVLANAIAPMRELVDFILFDNSPTVSLFTPSILGASDWVLIPSRMMSLDLNGVNEIVTTMTKMASLHQAQILGIVPTQAMPNTLEYQERLSDMRNLYGDLLWAEEQTTYSTIWGEASNVAMPIFQYQPSHKASDQIIALGNKVMKALEVVNVH